MAEKWTSGPARGKIVETNGDYYGHSSHFLAIFPDGPQKPFVGQFFSFFWREAQNGSVPAQRDHNSSSFKADGMEKGERNVRISSGLLSSYHVHVYHHVPLVAGAGGPQFS